MEPNPMTRLPAWLAVPAAALAVALNTVVHVVPLLLVALVKAALPWRAARRRLDWLLMAIAQSWIGINSGLIDGLTRTRFEVAVEAALRPDGHYLVLANHQSWVDIPVLQKVFNRRIPLLRFFLKRQLIWVPLLGLAWWALDFPFMRRYTRAQLARRPELAGRDIAATRRACARFADIPVAIMNFVEGTRFTGAKHDSQGSPYRHLLRPKSGGAAFVIDAMGSGLHAVLDVTLVYPGGAPSLADLFANRVRQVHVHVRELPIPAELAQGDYQGDPGYRARFQDWINAIWLAKDARIAAVLEHPVQGGDAGLSAPR
jgi:1-acyl-sn-glycerol-3-phosphate acyltransferase